MAEEVERREVYYSGHVQGVGFRYTVHALAQSFTVTGFVKNLPDGQVHLVVEGQATEVRGLLGAIRREMGHYIREALETSSPATGHFDSFEIRF